MSIFLFLIFLHSVSPAMEQRYIVPPLTDICLRHEVVRSYIVNTIQNACLEPTSIKTAHQNLTIIANHIQRFILSRNEHLLLNYLVKYSKPLQESINLLANEIQLFVKIHAHKSSFEIIAQIIENDFLQPIPFLFKQYVIDQVRAQAGWPFLSTDNPHIFHMGTVNKLIFSPDNKFLANLLQQTVNITNIQTEKCIQKLHHSELINTLFFLPDNNLLVTGSKTGKIYVWNWKNNTCIRTIQEDNIIADFDISDDNKTLLVTCLPVNEDGHPVFFNYVRKSFCLLTWQLKQHESHHFKSLFEAGNSPLDTHPVYKVETFCHPSHPQKMTIGKKQQEYTLTIKTIQAPAIIRRTVFSPNGLHLAVALANGDVQLYSVDSLKKIIKKQIKKTQDPMGY